MKRHISFFFVIVSQSVVIEGFPLERVCVFCCLRCVSLVLCNLIGEACPAGFRNIPAVFACVFVAFGQVQTG